MSTETPPLHEEPTLPLPQVTGEPPEPPPVPGGTPEPRLPHRHRRGALIALIAGAAVLVIGVPLVLLAVLGGGSGRTAGPSAAPSTQAAPPAGASSAKPSPSGTGRAAAPDGRIPLGVLRNATFDVPPWAPDGLQGQSGVLRFRDGEAVLPAGDSGPHILIKRVAYGDVDRDGAQETVVQIDCVYQGGAQQLVALDRDTAGRIVTLGRVVRTSGELRSIGGEPFAVGPTGVVSAQVGDYQACCGDRTPVQYQWRGYGWNGVRFLQVSGPTSFPVNARVTETNLNAGELVLGPATDGVRHGTLTVTAGYVRGTPPDHLVLWFQPPANLERDGTAWPPTHPSAGYGFEVYLPTPAVGTGHTYTFAFRLPAGADVRPMGLSLRGVTATSAQLGESNPYDNNATVQVRVAE